MSNLVLTLIATWCAQAADINACRQDLMNRCIKPNLPPIGCSPMNDPKCRFKHKEAYTCISETSIN